jgi:hypothetical protein
LVEAKPDNIQGPPDSLSNIALSFRFLATSPYLSCQTPVAYFQTLELLGQMSRIPSPAMESSTLHAQMPFSRPAPTSLSGLSSFAIDGAKFSFYLLSVAGFLATVVSGIVLVQAQYALKAITEKDRLVPTAEDRQSRIHKATNTDCALTQRDLEATAVMRRARIFALFGPLPSVLPMIAIPVSLHLNSVGDIGVRVLLSVLLIGIIHFANACTLQNYFCLIEKETRVSFGSEVCSPRDEKMRSRYLFIYLTVLFALSSVKTKEKDEHADVATGWEPATTYSPLPFRVARLSEGFSDVESIVGEELQRLA